MSSEPSELLAQIDLINARLGSISGSAADDLPALAELHTSLGNVISAAEKTLEAAQIGAVTSAANTGMQLLEQIVLREVDNVNVAIAQVSKTVRQLRGIVSGEALVAAVSSTSKSTSAASAHPPAPLAEQAPLNENDIPLVQEFIVEAAGHIEAAETGLLKLE